MMIWTESTALTTSVLSLRRIVWSGLSLVEDGFNGENVALHSVSCKETFFLQRIRLPVGRRKRNLPCAAQIINQIAHLLVSQWREQSLRHHREFTLLQRLDFIARQHQELGLCGDSDGLVVLLFHNSRNAPAV